MEMDTTLGALLDALADRIAARLSTPPAAPRYYDASRPPPGAASWRAARALARREGLALARVGRSVAIDAHAWHAMLSRRASGGPLEIADRDASALRALGLVLPGETER